LPCGAFTYPTGKKDSRVKMTPEFKKKLLIEGARLLQLGKSEEYILSRFYIENDIKDNEVYSLEHSQGISSQDTQRVNILFHSDGSQGVPNMSMQEFNTSSFSSLNVQRPQQSILPEEYIEELNIPSESTIDAEGSGQLSKFPYETPNFDLMNPNLTYSFDTYNAERDGPISDIDYDDFMRYLISLIIFF
jgi:hypothetical protein